MKAFAFFLTVFLIPIFGFLVLNFYDILISKFMIFAFVDAFWAQKMDVPRTSVVFDSYHIYNYTIIKISFALSYVILATSSKVIPLTSAIFCAIYFTFLGSFLVPLTGSGAK